MKNKLYIFLIISLALHSCDEVFDYNFYVKNLTNKEISVIYHTNNEIQNYWDTILVEQNTRKKIYIEHAAGGRELRGVDVRVVFDTFFVMNDTVKSNINFLKNDRWEYKEITDNLGEYTLTIDSTFFK